MNVEEFWAIIESVDRGALLDGLYDEAVAPLITRLAVLPESEIEDFQCLLARALYELDGERYSDNSGENGNSDDGFLDCRCFVVAMGESYYNDRLADPTLMPKSHIQTCEELLPVASGAWARRTGNQPSEWSYQPDVSPGTRNRSQWPPLPPREERHPYDEPDLQRAATRAGHEFRRKRYKQVILLLEQHEAALSKRQLKLLGDARSQCLRSDNQNPS